MKYFILHSMYARVAAGYVDAETVPPWPRPCPCSQALTLAVFTRGDVMQLT